jgi:SNF2 family DNA or RNA helicase
LKSDRSIIADLPEKLEMKVFCKLTKEQARLYDDVVRAQFQEISKQSGMARRGSILATLSKLKQVCNHPLQLLRDGGQVPGRSGKLLRLEEMLEEIRENGEKALVFSQFAEMGEILQARLAEKFNEKVFFLYGGTKREERDRMVEEFHTETGPGIFVLSLKAGGTGLNLTAATHVFHYDRWWNPAVENQATDRAYRIGQTQQVEVHKFLSMGTVEERIDLMLEQKKQLAEQVVDGAETWLTEMSNDELRELFTLTEDALAD